MISESVAIEQMLSRGTTERPAADNHDVEESGIWAPRCAPERFVQPIANIAPDHVLAEVSVLSSWTCRHRSLSCSSTGRFYGRCPSNGALVFLWEARCGRSRASDSVIAGCAPAACQLKPFERSLFLPVSPSPTV